jgi:hypothetical protein
MQLFLALDGFCWMFLVIVSHFPVYFFYYCEPNTSPQSSLMDLFDRNIYIYIHKDLLILLTCALKMEAACTSDTLPSSTLYKYPTALSASVINFYKSIYSAMNLTSYFVSMVDVSALSGQTVYC